MTSSDGLTIALFVIAAVVIGISLAWWVMLTIVRGISRAWHSGRTDTERKDYDSQPNR